MFPGFGKIVEERILQAQKRGDFKNLEGTGKPLILKDERHIPEDLRLAHKILKNADCIPPEIELKKEIARTEELLENMVDVSEKYKVMNKLNFLIMKLNSMRKSSMEFDVPQKYMEKVVTQLDQTNKREKR